MDFSDEIKERLQNLNREQINQFAWLCGVRALPFLCGMAYFAFGSKDEQKHLYSIFNALDVCVGGGMAIPMEFANAATININSATFIRATAATTAAGAAADSVRARAIAKAITYAVYTANYVARDAIAKAKATAIGAAEAAAEAAENATHYTFVNILFADIEAIKNHNFDTLNNDTSIYGTIWQNFLEDLNAIGCGYWARLYENLFKNRFIIDKKELERRLSVPESIRSLGAATVAAWVTEPQARLNEARVIILGEKGAGKTSLAKKLLNPEEELDVSQASTEGVDVFLWELRSQEDAVDMKVHIWDFAGHALTHAAHRYFLNERCVYVIVGNGRTEDHNNVQKWLDHVRYYGNKSPAYILTNIHDESPVKIDKNYLLDEFRDNIRDEKDFVKLSLKDDTDAVKAFRDRVIHLLRNEPAWDKGMPEKWYTVKQMLEDRFKKNGSELILIQEFNNVAKEAGVKDEREMTMIKRSLNVLGICLWYEKIPNLQAYVLDPNWISHAVYKILNWLGKKEDFRLHTDNFSEIFHAEEDVQRYLEDKRRGFLFALLESYEMAYPVRGQDNLLILPSMFSEEQPKRGMEDNFPIKDSYLARYKVNGVIPLDVITRFIVHHHQEIVEENGKQLAWRRGVALRDNAGNDALVIEGRSEIRLSVKGKTALAYFEKLQSSFNAIFESYDGTNTEFEYVIVEIEGQKHYKDRDTMVALAQNPKGFTIGEINVDARAFLQKIGIDIENMTTNIINGSSNSQITNVEGSPNTIVNSNIALPDRVSEEQFAQVLEILEQFLKSEYADDLKRKDCQKLQTAIDEARSLGQEEGWRKILATCADVVTLGTPFYAYLTAHPEIPQAICSMFVR